MKIINMIIFLSIGLFFSSCVYDEISVVKNFVPEQPWKVEIIKNYENKFLEDQKPVITFHYYMDEYCVNRGKVSSEFKPNLYVVFVKEWSKEKYKKFEEMQAEVEEIDDERENCTLDCYEKNCDKKEVEEYYNRMTAQEISPVPYCMQECRSTCAEKFNISNKYNLTPHIKSKYIPDDSTKKYSLYFFQEAEDFRTVFEFDPNKPECDTSKIWKDIEYNLCKKGMLFWANSDVKKLIDDCSIFKIGT